VFPRLADAATAFGYDAGARWDPYRFIDFVEQARRRPGSKDEQLALAVQRLEWQALFGYCAGPQE
jgi:hypothetical protein